MKRKDIHIITYSINDFAYPDECDNDLVEAFEEKEQARKRLKELKGKYDFDDNHERTTEDCYFSEEDDRSRCLEIQTRPFTAEEKSIFVLVEKGEVKSAFENEQDALEKLKDNDDAKLVCVKLL